MAKQAKSVNKVVASSGNVFADLGLPDAAALDTKVRLAVAVNRLCRVILASYGDVFVTRGSLVRLTVKEYLEIDAGCELPASSGRLRAQSHAECTDNLRHGFEARIAVRRECLIKAGPGDAGVLR